jgi:putative zinc finger/helix-turn-helix YgiT family protein
MKCTECGNVMTKSVGDHVYRESGLDNVTLRNVTTYACESCGAKRVLIPNMGPLHRAIALALADKPARLLPQEVRFIRDHLGLSNKQFAEIMGVRPEQSSRWVGEDPIGIPAERFLRVLATMGPELVASPEDDAEHVEKSSVPAPQLEEVTRELRGMLAHLPAQSSEAKPVDIRLRRQTSGWSAEPTV